ncbi:acyltransferase family protein [Desertivirga brevis]|uniref:acyltransferase family protein n=1 Tax=Desertivirga brevis TaxID=2810310 RepID=UPI001A95E93E|nr:acyltransferase [Pedobacter sp. SYSU D00873]
MLGQKSPLLLFHMTKVYFPNLNGLRFIAAFLVIIHHVELLKGLFGINNNFNMPFFMKIGKMGVVLFFILSGYLITYLLLAELNKTGKIAIKDFYLRRILRIWPVYFLVVISSLFILPKFEFFDIPSWTSTLSDDFYAKLIFSLLFLANIPLALFDPIPYGAQTWSVAIEEQFYLVWPLIIKRTKGSLSGLIGVITVFLLVKFLLVIDNHFTHFATQSFKAVWETFNLDCMAIGGVGAYYKFHKKIPAWFYNPVFQIFIIICTTFMLVKGITFPYYLNYDVYGIFFLLIIMNLSEQSSIVNLENKLLNYLGQISYGIYMYHILAITIAIKVAALLGDKNDLIIYGLTLTITIAIAAFSFRFLETPFIKRKSRYTKIVSGESARL